MKDKANPEAMRQMIVERLVGATGDPERVSAAARACATRALPAMLESLGQQLASPVEFELKSIDIVRLGETMPAAESNDAVTIAASAGSADALAMQIDTAAISILLAACFGGDPETPPAPIDRPLTAIERNVAAIVFEAFAKAVNGRGERAFDFRFPLPEPLCGVELKRLPVRDGPGVRIVFSVATPAGAGEFRALMPQRFLLENRGATPSDQGSATAQQASWRARFGGEVMRSAVPLQATVPMARMTLGEIAALRVGQLIELPTAAQTETKLLARDRALFVCEFGKVGESYTVRVRHPYDAGREFIEGLMS